MIQNLISTCPRNYDFQYSEGELDIMLMLQTLKEVNDRRLQTTLIPPEPLLAKKLGSYLTVIVIKDGIEMLVTANDRPIQPILKQPPLWKDYLFKPYGFKTYCDEPKDEFTPPSSSVSSIHPATTIVDQWVERSASGKLDNPFSPDPIQANSDSVHEVIVQSQIEPPAPPPLVRKRYAKTRKPVGMELPTASELPQAAVPNLREIPATGSTFGSPIKVVNEQEINPPPIEPPYMPNPLLIPTGSPLMPIESPSTELPPYMSIDPRASQPGDHRKKGQIWDRKVAGCAPLGSLIDFSSPASPVQDKLRKADEEDTRRLQHTMNQRKAASHFGASKSSFAAFLSDFEIATTDILRLARASQGPVTLRIEIGRILINYKSGSNDFKKKHFSIGEWPKVFPREGKSRLETRFTNM